MVCKARPHPGGNVTPEGLGFMKLVPGKMAAVVRKGGGLGVTSSLPKASEKRGFVMGE